MSLELKHTMDVTNLALKILKAQNYDRANCAAGLAIIASVLAKDDEEAKTFLAMTMLKLAWELDPALCELRRWN